MGSLMDAQGSVGSNHRMMTVSIKEVCLMGGISRSTFYKFLRPSLRAITIGRRVLYLKKDVESFFQNRYRDQNDGPCIMAEDEIYDEEY